jgi:hypothetical protein
MREEERAWMLELRRHKMNQCSKRTRECMAEVPNINKIAVNSALCKMSIKGCDDWYQKMLTRQSIYVKSAPIHSCTHIMHVQALDITCLRVPEFHYKFHTFQLSPPVLHK